ncbi:hypothetical protein ZIOFF_037571 [Zingiber officinale]|uniref:Uncharacterized protein n=1 Tax=Zingiber officinale TaxID=94328 RepID=A0A8J5GSC5_ZINOF|nr:hypothetical protein ZIOFF_037571 [Zingiber officinale]
MEGEGIIHKQVEANKIQIHLTEKEEGSFRALTPDLRGYDDSFAPPDVASYFVFHVVGNLVALLDALALPQVMIALALGKEVDWNAMRMR